MTEWFKASKSVLSMAQELIEAHHVHLRGARIGFIFRDTAAYTGAPPHQKRVLGKAAKVSPRDKVYSSLDFVIWLAEDFWLGEATDDMRRALLDHELCHCAFDEETEEWKLRQHDIEEFKEIIERHGLWSSALWEAAGVLAAAAQQVLPGFEAAAHAKNIHALGGELVAVEPGLIEQ